MSKRTYDLIKKWQRGEITGDKREGNIHFDSKAIYSYGTHFPIVVKNPSGLLIGNGDRYSSSTSRHQSDVRSAVSFDVLLPFSGLRTLNVDPFRDRIEVIHRQQDKRIPTIGKRKNRQTGQMEEYTCERHVLGGSLIHVYACAKDKWVETKDTSNSKWVRGKESKTPRVFVQAWDETGTARRGEGMFFMSELPKEGKNCKTVDEALALLKPSCVHAWEAVAKQEVQRQGEWFFMPVTPAEMEKSNPILISSVVPDEEGNPTTITTTLKHCVLKGRGTGTGHHEVDTMRTGPKGKQYVQGNVRHRRREHKMLKLGREQWFLAVENTAVMSVSMGGNVD
jgi:hypothetical protein